MLPVIPFDTHAAVKTLTAAGASEQLAVAVVGVAQEAAAEHGRELATRTDIAELRAEIAAHREATRADTKTIQASIETLRDTTRADTAEVRAQQARMETRLIKWVVGTALVVGALVVGVLRLLP